MRRLCLIFFVGCAFASDTTPTLSVEEKLQLRDMAIAILQAQLRAKDFETQAQAAYAQAREGVASLNAQIKDLKEKHNVSDDYQIDPTLNNWVLSKTGK